MENSSTDMHGWNTQVRKTQVHVCSGRKRKYEKKKEVYGQNVVAEGCRFHFAQAVVRKAKKIGLSSAFRDDAEGSKCIRCLTCLPLLSPDDIDNALTDLETFFARVIRLKQTSATKIT